MTRPGASSTGRDYTAVLQWLEWIIALGAYMYVATMFFDKGEGIRNLGLYGSLSAWAIRGVITRSSGIRATPLVYCFMAYVAAVLFTTAFSLDPGYSFWDLKEDVFVGTILFIVTASSFDKPRTIMVARILAVVGLTLFALGAESYFTGDAETFFRSENAMLSANKNRYALFLGFIFPFGVYNLVSAGSGLRRGLWALWAAVIVVAIVFSGSRGGIVNVLMGMGVWGAFLMRKASGRTFAVLAAVCLLSIIITVSVIPSDIRRHLLSLDIKDIGTLNMRTDKLWLPAMQAVSERPFTGWGSGSRILRDPRPFEEGLGLPKWFVGGGLHSTFMRTLFQHGLIGLSTYLALLMGGVWTLRNMLKESDDITIQRLAACLLAVMLGTFVIHSILKIVAFRYLALVLGLTVAVHNDHASGRNPRQG